MSNEVFGPIVTGGQVEDAVEATLRKWLPTYIAEVSGQDGRSRSKTPNIASWQVVPDFETWPESKFPALVIVSTGVSGKPKRKAGGVYSAPWAFGIGVFCKSNSLKNMRDLSKIYGAAIRAVLVQHSSLGDFASGLDWEDERYDDLEFRERTYAAARLVFTVEVDEVVRRSAGPAQADPNYDPTLPYDPVTIIDTEIIVEREL